MDFKLTDEQQMFYDTVRRFAEAELAEGAAARACAESYPWDVAARFAQMGLLGITIPEADGGIGGGLVNAILAIQAVAEVCPRSGDVIQAANFRPGAHLRGIRHGRAERALPRPDPAGQGADFAGHDGAPRPDPP